MYQRLLDILYPPRCPICQEIVDRRGHLLCDACRKHVRPIQEPCCRKCGKPLDCEEKEYCADCERKTHYYTRGIAVFPNTGAIQKSIYQLKFHNKREYVPFFVDEMAKYGRKKAEQWKPEALIPVPMHRKKERQRGFNQAALLAEGLGKAWNIPVRTDLILRIRKTLPQKEMIERNRQNNLKNAFKMTQFDVKLKRVMIVDDIYTTGNTIDAIAQELRKAGVEEIYFITLCIGVGDC